MTTRRVEGRTRTSSTHNNYWAVQGILFFTAAILVAFALSGLWLLSAFLTTLIIGALILSNWRWGIYALILYIPFAGLPTILLYPAPSVTRIIKDVLFVIPTYVGFSIWFLQRRRPETLFLRAAPVALYGCLTVLLIGHLMNPNLESLFVGLIGLKVWLLYIPLSFVGYCLIDSQARLYRVAKLMIVVSMVPVAIGIAEAVLIYSGYAETVYTLYGPAAGPVTQNFTSMGLMEKTGTRLFRVASTFTSVTQYSTFLFAMLPVSYAMWVRAKHRRERSWCYFLALALLVFAALTSGSRAALVLIPVYFFFVSVFEGRWQRSWKIMAAIIVGFVIFAALLGLRTIDVVDYTVGVVRWYAGSQGVSDELVRAFNLTWIGWGPGMSTGAARYAFDTQTIESGIAPIEGFYGKTIVEMGLPGLIIVLAIFARLLLAGYASLNSLGDLSLRVFGCALLTFLLLTMGYLLKGALLDYDPINVYFWLFAGILMKLPRVGFVRKRVGSLSESTGAHFAVQLD